MGKKVCIAVYKRGEEYYAQVFHNGQAPEQGYEFMVEGVVELHNPGRVLRMAKLEARKRGIAHVKNLD